jgi:hypothetical protein
MSTQLLHQSIKDGLERSAVMTAPDATSMETATILNATESIESYLNDLEMNISLIKKIYSLGLI